MNTPSQSKWLALTTFVCACFTFSATAADFDQAFDVKAGGQLELKTESGSIQVRTHKAATVLVEVDIKGRDAEDFEVTAELSGNTVSVNGEVDGRGWNRKLQVEFLVTVPKEFNVDLDTAGGSIKVSDLNGDLMAHTSGGSIRIGAVRGKVELNTSGGSIQTEEIYGSLNAHTSGGSIRATFAEQLQEDAVLDTSGGSIVAYLLPESKIDLDASTSGGRVKTDFKVNGRIKKQSIRGEINGGGPELRLRTSGGSVTIREL